MAILTSYISKAVNRFDSPLNVVADTAAIIDAEGCIFILEVCDTGSSLVNFLADSIKGPAVRFNDLCIYVVAVIGSRRRETNRGIVSRRNDSFRGVAIQIGWRAVDAFWIDNFNMTILACHISRSVDRFDGPTNSVADTAAIIDTEGIIGAALEVCDTVVSLINFLVGSSINGPAVRFKDLRTDIVAIIDSRGGETNGAISRRNDSFRGVAIQLGGHVVDASCNENTL
mmetsp:Transcript_4755/g.6614  ORF Transcript_4755/g.6614 Transcript_4755/m.6614 type:complete len:228 (+) Transcript_4755:146-829(+)